MKYYLYRFHSDGNPSTEQDFVALEVAAHIEAAVPDLNLDILSDVYHICGAEPSQVQVSAPEQCEDSAHPNATYAIRAEIAHEKSVRPLVLWYGVKMGE